MKSGKTKKVGNVQVNSLQNRGSGQNSNYRNSITQRDTDVNTKILQTDSEQYLEWYQDTGINIINKKQKTVYLMYTVSFTVLRNTPSKLNNDCEEEPSKEVKPSTY